jgi:DNA gyrase subunit A
MTSPTTEVVEFSGEFRSSFKQFGLYDNYRMLPDAIDGLQPVHRRILWGMYQMGSRPDRKRVKSARADGEVTGKYHPHGSVYGTIVGLTQPFNKLLPLVDGQGNFGSLSFGPAAARYTECRLAPSAMALLGVADFIGAPEIAENGVDLNPNYSGEFDEPTLLPALWPNFVVNANMGIGTGIAAKTAAHNLSEVMELAIRMVDNPNPRMSTVLEILPGPDMPCDADIFDNNGGIASYITTGKGTFTMRAQYSIEEYGAGTAVKRGRGKAAAAAAPVEAKGKRIVFTGLPYLVDPDKVMESIASLVTNELLPRNVEVINATSSKGLRIIVDVKENDPEDIVQRLLHYVRAGSVGLLQQDYSVNMNAWLHGSIQQVGVLDALRAWIVHRRQVVKRRSRYRLNKAQERLELVVGFLKAVPIAKEIVDVVTKSKDRAAAAEAMMKKWGFTLNQAQAVLSLTIGQITKLGVEKYQEEKAELEAIIDECNNLLHNPKELDLRLKKEMREAKKAFATPRRCNLRLTESSAIEKPKTPAIERVPVNGFFVRTGSNWVRWAERSSISNVVGNDYVVQLSKITDLDFVEGVSNLGNHHRVAASSLPKKMTKVDALFSMEPGEKIIFSNSDAALGKGGNDLVLITAKGMIKRIENSIYMGHRVNRVNSLITLDEGDSVKHVFLLPQGAVIGAITANGRMIKVASDAILAKGKKARGIPLVKFTSDTDGIVWSGVVTDDDKVIYWTDKQGAGSFAASSLEVLNRNVRGDLITKSKGPLAGAVVGKGETLKWFDGLSDDPESVSYGDIRTSLISADRQLTQLSKSIKTANAVWLDT